MSGDSNQFDASSSAAGYYYQARLALAECLTHVYDESELVVSIERLDDVAFELEGSALELIQTKHHISKPANLTNASEDLWKTIRIWAERAKADPALVGSSRLLLITTSQAPKGSVASLLRADEHRDVDAALAVLQEVTSTSANAGLQPAFVAFNSLSSPMKKALVSAVEVVDRAPSLLDLQGVIENRLKILAPRGKAALAREYLEGWWWPRVCKTLIDGTGTISILEVEAKLDDIREKMHRDALPLDMEHAEPSESELSAFNDLPFVRQLAAIGLGENRIRFAKRHYYRAFTQRSKWTRQSLLFDGEVEKYEKTLIEGWEPRYYQMCDSMPQESDEVAVRNAAQELYAWVEQEANFPFRSVSARFLSVGSYHILANDVKLGWHKDFASLLKGGTDE